MAGDDIRDAEENIAILIGAELEIHHRLEGHGRAIPQCPLCQLQAQLHRPRPPRAC